jgi:hypothetical protein
MRKAMETSDKIAIALASLGIALLIYTFLVPRTRTSVAILLFFLFVFVAYPILHFVPPRWLKLIGVGVAGILVISFGKTVWPGPSSDLRIQDENLNPPEANKPVSLNLHILNNASETINGRIYETISFTGPVTSMDEEYRMEEEKWGVLKKYVETADAVSSPFTPGISWLSVTDPRAVLSQTAIDGIQSGTGSEALRFMLVIQYSDSSGEHELDHCMMIQKPGVYYNCRNHNGPSEPMKHK